MYYCIEYLYCEEKNGIYSHLPVTSQVTRDLQVAQEWYETAKKVHLDSWRGNKLISEQDRKLDYMCYIKSALFECSEAGYQKGFYEILLSCYSHNPCLVE